MSNRPQITKALSLALEHYLNPQNDTRIYISKEVSFDYATNHSVRVDYMRFCPVNNSVSGIEKGDFYCYEIKSSVEDFHSKNGHNFIGDFNYYIMPEDVYDKIKDKIPYGVGVYTSLMKECNGLIDLKLTKNARRKLREKSATEMLFMMFRSSARDNVKHKINVSQSAIPKDALDIIKNSKRYKNFVIFEKPIRFKDMQYGNDIEIVQTHSIATFESDDIGNKGIVGFNGQFSWENNTIKSLDGDSYSDKMLVFGYEWWNDKENNVKGLDILTY